MSSSRGLEPPQWRVSGLQGRRAGGRPHELPRVLAAHHDIVAEPAPVSCRSCAVKAKVTDSVVSLVAGWWGFPWGLVMTPVQLGRNIIGLVRPSDTMGPSLEKAVRTMIAARLAERPRAG